MKRSSKDVKRKKVKYDGHWLSQIEYLTLTFGLLLGIGGSLAYTPSLVILGHYFRRRMGLVNGIVTAGSSLFTMFMPMLFQTILTDYGLKVLFQVLSAQMALLMVSILWRLKYLIIIIII